MRSFQGGETSNDRRQEIRRHMNRRTILVAGSFLFCCAALVMSGAKAQSDKGDADKGKATFEQCAVCHNVDSPDKKMGPSLQGLFKRKTLQSGKPVTDE